MSEESKAFEGWVFLELMGHRRLGGYLEEELIAGSPFLRLDVWVPDGEAPEATQFYSPAAVYCITPTTAEVARAFAVNHVPRPVSRLELEPPLLAAYAGDAADLSEPDPDCECGHPLSDHREDDGCLFVISVTGGERTCGCRSYREEHAF